MTRMNILKVLLPAFKCFRGSGFQKILSTSSSFLIWIALSYFRYSNIPLQTMKHESSNTCHINKVSKPLEVEYIFSELGRQALDK